MEIIKEIVLIIVIAAVICVPFYLSDLNLQEDLCNIEQENNLTYSYYNFTTKEVTTKDSKLKIYNNICLT